MRQRYYKGVPIPPCPKIKVMVTRRKGRVGAGLIGGILLGPIGLTAGALRGSRDESTWEEREPTIWERGQWITTWKQEFDQANPNFVPVTVPKKPMGWLMKGFLWYMAFNLATGIVMVIGSHMGLWK